MLAFVPPIMCWPVSRANATAEGNHINVATNKTAWVLENIRVKLVSE
jgi:hypothetical protein